MKITKENYEKLLKSTSPYQNNDFIFFNGNIPIDWKLFNIITFLNNSKNKIETCDSNMPTKNKYGYIHIINCGEKNDIKLLIKIFKKSNIITKDLNIFDNLNQLERDKKINEMLSKNKNKIYLFYKTKKIKNKCGTNIILCFHHTFIKEIHKILKIKMPNKKYIIPGHQYIDYYKKTKNNNLVFIKRKMKMNPKVKEIIL
jgi:hypothetical protein